MKSRTLWLRKETKAGEERTLLTPYGVKILVDEGQHVVVESCSKRAFTDQAYIEAGAELVYDIDWLSAPQDAFILGLKELPESNFSLAQTHIYFAHAFKGQNSSEQLLKRFSQGMGTLYDLEYLVDEKNRRVAAFGKWAGYVGAALAVDIWAMEQIGEDYNQARPLQSFSNSKDLLNSVIRLLNTLETKPRALVIGGKGRSSKGAQDFLKTLGLDYDVWGKTETKQGGPFEEILDYDILVNCVFVDKKIPPFLTSDLLSRADKKLSVISDVSCDPDSNLNPLPIYQQITTLDQPVREIAGNVKLTAIDHLPSLLPKESSLEFEAAFLPHFIQFLGSERRPLVWQKAWESFHQALQHSVEISPRL